MRRRDRNLVARQEERLLDLIRQAERHACALAHSYDVGGQADRAFAYVALGERLHGTASDISSLARPVEPHGVAPVHGLRLRALSLRRLLSGASWQDPRAAPLLPKFTLDDERGLSLTPAEHSA